jgi:valyl-tRNA synthetase
MSTERRVPEKPSLEGLEERWGGRWEADGTFRFDRSKLRSEIFSVDTPPPTVSGSLHMGSVFGYVQTDTLVRYQRMRGREVFYPMGWDDNGLATERRVQNYYGVRCDPSLPYDPDFEPPADPAEPAIPVSRRNFVALCERLTVTDEQAFEALWRRLGLSVDWSMTYTTIGDRARQASQRMFLRNLSRSEAYLAEAPTLWDVTDRTAVAQAELEDRERAGAMHRVAFHRADGEPVLIDTTRPELLAACVALVAHPDDERYRPLFEGTVRTPVFGVEVPVKAHPLADPDKGTGIAMICTFGDVTDVTWWRELNLPTRAIIDRGGRIRTEPPAGLDGDGARDAYARLAGSTVHAAREQMVSMLRESGDLRGEPTPITHPVKFYERGDKPLEIVASRQWYIRNGGRDEDLRAELLARGSELHWHPSHMEVRYRNWVSGLNGDWLISRQRFFGVAFPVWYRLDGDGEAVYDDPILADEASLPVDPSSDCPPGYREEQRGEPDGFMGDPDVMDTWATSSLTPQIVTGWECDDDLFARTFPMDLRPQGPEIIRTWLFATLLRSHYEHHNLPWTHATLNGWVLDPDRKKMSKSKGNVVTPMPLIERHGSDAVRYWAANGAPGTDTAVDEGQMKIGRRLAIKILNASRFALNLGPTSEATVVSAPLDRAMLVRLADLVDDATAALDAFHYTRAIERTEAFFWGFCDDYLELVKGRAYGSRGDEGAASAKAALAHALSTVLRLFAPYLPFATEEVWSWWQEGSIHLAPWPGAGDLRAAAGEADAEVLVVASDVLGAVRKAKSDARVSMRADVARARVTGPAEQLARLRAAEEDLAEAGRIAELELVEGEDTAVEVDLA